MKKKKLYGILAGLLLGVTVLSAAGCGNQEAAETAGETVTEETAEETADDAEVEDAETPALDTEDSEAIEDTAAADEDTFDMSQIDMDSLTDGLPSIDDYYRDDGQLDVEAYLYDCGFENTQFGLDNDMEHVVYVAGYEEKWGIHICTGAFDADTADLILTRTYEVGIAKTSWDAGVETLYTMGENGETIGVTQVHELLPKVMGYVTKYPDAPMPYDIEEFGFVEDPGAFGDY